MKAIYAKDIKAMVKKFNLTDDESEYLNDIAEAINKERTEICEDIQSVLLYGSMIDEKRAQSVHCLFTLEQRHKRETICV